MLFSSNIFIFVFLPIVILLYYTIFRFKFKNLFLLVSSLIFYGWGEPKFIIIMIMSIFMNYIFGLLVDKFREDKSKAKNILVFSMTLNIVVLFIFKYLTFTIYNINMYGGYNLNVPSITLPIGISFFTFQAISYVVDVYRNDGKVQKNLFNVALYIAFFPQLVAGPIVKYSTVDYEINNRKETFKDFSNGVWRFIIGLSKKVLISNTMAVIADAAFSNIYSGISVSFAWLGAIAYTLQIFYDFSGYSDMAIGLGLMFGFHFEENFNYPYISQNVSEFWRRWHISLGKWFKEYVYFPLGGSRVKSNDRKIINLFVVWILTGIWHGSSWTFVLWGLMYFLLITVEKFSGFDKRPCKKIWINHLYTLLAVIIGWVIFRSNTISEAGMYLKSMIGIGANGLVDNVTIMYIKENIIFFITGILFSMPVIDYITKKIKRKKIYAILEFSSSIIVFILFIICITYLVKNTYNPFIYFNF
ncbi:MBOAT family O-acyltransferase [uncultured Clostridium sp.]|uniref:MBOAT family O-acyltransferase n=1 Tax=uncultured Clostridium sp. TaxID=59620 RepID=UPI0025E027F5|nr:MBOAT family O-acyltransferase [uncultured Clostridium sp.]